MTDRAITLRKSEWLDDWYCIEWAEHDNQHWMKPTGPNSSSLMCSSRISGADIEGTAEEMAAIASAIEEGRSESFKRCAAYRNPEGSYDVCSPRNDINSATITAAQAAHLAGEIRRVLALPVGPQEGPKP